MTEYDRTFYIGTQKIVFDEIFDTFNLYRRSFFHLSDICSVVMDENIQEYIDNNESLTFKEFDEFVLEIVDDTMADIEQIAIDFLIEEGIQNIDEQRFRKRYKKKYYDFRSMEGYQYFLETIDAFLNAIYNLKEYRNIQRKKHSGWMVGGRIRYYRSI